MAGEPRWIWAGVLAAALAGATAADAQGRRPWVDPPPGLGESSDKLAAAASEAWPDEAKRRRLPVLAQVEKPPVQAAPHRSQDVAKRQDPEPAATGSVAAEKTRAERDTAASLPAVADRNRLPEKPVVSERQEGLTRAKERAAAAEPAPVPRTLVSRPEPKTEIERPAARAVPRTAPGAGQRGSQQPQFFPPRAAETARPMEAARQSQPEKADWGASWGRHSNQESNARSDTETASAASSGGSGGSTAGGGGGSSAGSGGSAGGSSGSSSAGSSGGSAGGSSGGSSGGSGGSAGGSGGGSSGGAGGSGGSAGGSTGGDAGAGAGGSSGGSTNQ